MKELDEYRDVECCVVKRGSSTFVRIEDMGWMVVRFKNDKVDLLIPATSGTAESLSTALEAFNQRKQV